MFADANGNGVLDPGEASAITDSAGAFALSGGSGELVASGGTDITTGLRPTLSLTAPAGSSVIDPLTTLLDAYATLTGADPRSAQPQLVAALGLPDLTTLDPSAALLAGNGLASVLDAKIMDTLTDFQAYLAGNGIIASNGFAHHRPADRRQRPGRRRRRDRNGLPRRRRHRAGRHRYQRGHRRAGREPL